MEMMTDVEHSSLAISAAIETGLPVWIGTSCSLHDDGSLSAWNIHMEEPANTLSPDHVEKNSGIGLDGNKSYASLIEAMMSFNPQVMGVMHSTVDTTDPGITALFEQWNGPVMVYPESSSLQTRIGVGHEIEPDDFAVHCRDWVERGVQIIGGCCGTTIEHIRAMVNELPDTIGARC